MVTKEQKAKLKEEGYWVSTITLPTPRYLGTIIAEDEEYFDNADYAWDRCLEHYNQNNPNNQI